MIASLVGPLNANFDPTIKANCFNAVELYWQDLLLKHPGYPFGLIIEHAFVELDEERVFHKPDPKPSSRYEVIQRGEALLPYLKSVGYELTRHRRASSLS